MAQWDDADRLLVIQSRPHLFKFTACVLASLLGSLSALPAHAQAATPTPTKPATQQEINLYSQMGAVNICILNSTQVGLDKSLPASIETVVTVLEGLHGGVVQGVNAGQKLDRNQLLNGTIAQIVPRVQAICGTKLTPADKKKIDDILAQIRKAQGQQPGGGGK